MKFLEIIPAPKRTMERLSNQQPRSSHARQSHANVLRRKSIFIKDVSIYVQNMITNFWLWPEIGVLTIHPLPIPFDFIIFHFIV